MKILLWSVGKENDPYVKAGIDDFTRRIARYFPCEWNLINPPKDKKKEAALILGELTKDDYLVTLDERGKQMTSEGLAQFIQTRANSGGKNLVFLIGGAYGLDDSVLARGDYRWSLGNLTLPHQLVRLVLAEQIYRACTILRNEKYHHP